MPEGDTGQVPPCPPQLSKMVYCVAWGWTPAAWDACPRDTLQEWLTLWPLWQARQNELAREATTDAENTVHLPVYP